MSQFEALNELEIALEMANSGRLSIPNFIRMLVDFDLAVPSGGEVMADGSGLQPLLFDKERVRMVACFTAKERIGGFTALAPYCLVIKGIEFIRRVPPEYGLVINPGQPIGFDISPDGLSKIIADFG